MSKFYQLELLTYPQINFWGDFFILVICYHKYENIGLYSK